MGYVVFVIDLPHYDVADLSSVEVARSKCLMRYGVPEVIVNNAAIDNPPGSGASFFGNFDRIMDVNLTGAVNVCDVFLPFMVREKRGLIVNVGSIMGNIGADWKNYKPGFEKPVGYNCSKAALIQLSRSITTQYGRHGIRSATMAFGPYASDKLLKDQEFLGKFLEKVPLKTTITEKSLVNTLKFIIETPEFAGQQVLVDAGYTAW